MMTIIVYEVILSFYSLTYMYMYSRRRLALLIQEMQLKEYQTELLMLSF